jgi:hypothetical protein
MHPLVTPDERAQWENYTETNNNNNWIYEGVKVQNANPRFQGTNVTNWIPSPVIHGDTGLDGPEGKMKQRIWIWLCMITLMESRPIL